MDLPRLIIEYPPWVEGAVDWDRPYSSDADKMRVAIALSGLNVRHATGGPFGAAIFGRESGRLLAIGMNLVVRNRNSVLHAEILAFMMAEARLGSYTLRIPDREACELAASCDPCAMCLGATLWSGVERLLCGAGRDDAERLNFDEGPVFPASYQYLEGRGIEVVRGVCREEAAEVLRLYGQGGGVVYNP